MPLSTCEQWEPKKLQELLQQVKLIFCFRMCIRVTVALQNRNDGSLMRHELAYILGQMQIPLYNEILSAIVADETEDLLARHEVIRPIKRL